MNDIVRNTFLGNNHKYVDDSPLWDSTHLIKCVKTDIFKFWNIDDVIVVHESPLANVFEVNNVVRNTF